FLPHDVRQAFFGRWLPFVLRYYSSYKLPYAEAPNPILIAAAAIGLAAAAPALRSSARTSTRAALYACLGVFTAGGVGLFYWQDKGFFYHQIPALSGVVALLSTAAADGLSAASSSAYAGRGRVWIATAAAVVAWLVLVRVAPRVAPGRDDGNPP